MNDSDFIQIPFLNTFSFSKFSVTVFFLLILIIRGFTSILSIYLHGRFTYDNYFLLYKKLINNLLCSSAPHYNHFSNEEHINYLMMS